MTNEKTKFFDKEFNHPASVDAADFGAQQSPDNFEQEKKDGNVDAYLEAPRSYKKEYAELFRTLPPELRKYLHERESEAERGFSKINNELSSRRWIDDVFNRRHQRLERLGINRPQEWVETMACIDDALEKDPKGTLRFLADTYGIKLGDVVGASVHSYPLVDSSNFNQIIDRIQQLDDKLSEYSNEIKAQKLLAEKAEESKRAKEASFAPKGKNSDVDLSKLTTREVLELQMADWDD